MKLNATQGTNGQLRVNGALSDGGALPVGNLSGMLQGGDSFKLFAAASVSGRFSILAASPGPGLDRNCSAA